MVGILFLKLFLHSSNIPIGEDWFVVRAFTGEEPNLLSWLWTLNNEHRIPLPKLIMVAVLELTRDYRAVQALNIGFLAAVTAALLMTASWLRKRRYSYTDAFFPLLILNLGNIENYLWAWQLTFVCSVVLALVLLVVLVRGDVGGDTRRAWLAGGALILLPLTGATGLLLVPPLGGLLVYFAWLELRKPGSRPGPPAALLICAALAAAISLLYFTDYHPVSWHAPEISTLEKVRSAGRALALGLGSASLSYPGIGLGVTIAILAGTAWFAMRGVLRNRGDERTRALGIVVFLVASVAYMLALGFRRGSAVIFLYKTWPTRYVLLGAPAFCAAYFLWELYGPERLRRPLAAALTLLMFGITPLNTAHGEIWLKWVRIGSASLATDMRARLSPSEVAWRNRQAIPAWIDLSDAIWYLRLLRRAGAEPYSRMVRTDRASSRDQASGEQTNVDTTAVRGLRPVTVSYRLPGAAKVAVRWGVNGWALLPKQYRSPETRIAELVMETPLEREGDVFRVDLQVPIGAQIDLGFYVTACDSNADLKPVFDELDERPAIDVTRVEFASRLACQPDGSIALATKASMVASEFRYRNSSAAEVFVAWGVDGWKPVAQQDRPEGTRIVLNTMRTPMAPQGEWFTATLRAPAGSVIDYGFLITKKQGFTELMTPVWEPVGERHPVATSEPVIRDSQLPIRNQAEELMPGLPVIGFALAALLGTWLLLYGSIRVYARRWW